ncbi:MAG: hypothetical protein ACPGD5_04535 [Salibacteraceae bacterium]
MSDKLFQDIGQQFENQFQTSTGQMFGKPCLKTNKKAFVAFFKEEMVFKLSQQEVNLLKDKYPGSVNWDPSGKNRAMKEWLQVPVEFSNDWSILAKRALDFVNENN